MSAYAVEAQLGVLESVGLVELYQTEPELEYLFRHVLVQEVAYASMVRH
jgi:predicted ATPase